MPTIESTIATGSASFQANRDGMLALIARMRALEDRTRAASAAAKDRFHKRGQLLPRERVALVLGQRGDQITIRRRIERRQIGQLAVERVVEAERHPDEIAADRNKRARADLKLERQRTRAESPRRHAARSSTRFDQSCSAWRQRVRNILGASGVA